MIIKYNENDDEEAIKFSSNRLNLNNINQSEFSHYKPSHESVMLQDNSANFGGLVAE
jgi:hypothetical protein